MGSADAGPIFFPARGTLSEEQQTIFPLTREDIGDPERLDAILSGSTGLHWSVDWSPEFYVQLAKLGFISTAIHYQHADMGLVPLLLPEIQPAYCVLDWENLHAGRSFKRWMRSERFSGQGYRLELHHDLAGIIQGIRNCHGENCWVIDQYAAIVASLEQQRFDPQFQLFTPGLLTRSGQLVAGEIGYRIGRTYTSITGFLDRSSSIHNHAGKLQMHLLARHLQEQGYAFWNLGHPGMQYKLDLGGKILPRQEFLQRWGTAASLTL